MLWPGAGLFGVNGHDFSDLGMRQAWPVVAAQRGPGPLLISR
jgi:hypothetical protein